MDATSANFEALTKTREDEVSNLTSALERTQQINTELSTKVQEFEEDNARLVAVADQREDELASATATLAASSLKPTVDAAVGTGPDPQVVILQSQLANSILAFDHQQREMGALKRSMNQVVVQKEELELKEGSLARELDTLRTQFQVCESEKSALQNRVENLRQEATVLMS